MSDDTFFHRFLQFYYKMIILLLLRHKLSHTHTHTLTVLKFEKLTGPTNISDGKLKPLLLELQIFKSIPKHLG